MNTKNTVKKPPNMPDNVQALKDIISANLVQLISQNNMTQKDFAAKMGIAASTVSDYCKGT